MSSTLLRRLRELERDTRRLATLPEHPMMSLADFWRPYETFRMRANRWPAR